MIQDQKILWLPEQEFIENSNLRKFEKWLQKEKGLSFSGYQELWQWSTEHLEEFWECIARFFEVHFHTPHKQVLDTRKMPGAKWFEGATLNYAAHIFRKQSTDRPALIFQNEWGKQNISWEELTFQVKALQYFFEQQGIQKGDCIAGYIPNFPKAIACFLAACSLGAVWTCCSPDFGEPTVIERFSQIQPKLFIAVDGYQYNGKKFNRLEAVNNIRQAIPGIQQTIFIPYLDKKAALADSVHWQEILDGADPTRSLTFTKVPFSHPIWVLYSSGTTGKPKAITHSHGGCLLEQYKYGALHNDIKEGEHFFWFSTTGWMMWNLLQSTMLLGAIPVLFDGSPAYPDMMTLWKLAADLPIQHFGVSAPYLTTCMKQNLPVKTELNLKELRSIGSTGAPLPAEVFEWIYDFVKKDVWLCSMSGGTDVCTAFVGGNPYLPVYKGYIQSRALGAALYGYDEKGNRVVGSLGEMVLEQPMPSMPIYFWNDPQKKRYKESYFQEYPGKWRHGDWINIHPNGSLIIQGRSDATLNRGGIRIGTAEIYGVLDEIPGIHDSLILNLEQANGTDIMPLFIVLDKGTVLSNELIQTIKNKLKTKCSPRHVPNQFIPVKDIPYTLSGKKMEVPVKRLLMGLTQTSAINRDAIRNPEAMDNFIELKNQIQTAS